MGKRELTSTGDEVMKDTPLLYNLRIYWRYYWLLKSWINAIQYVGIFFPYLYWTSTAYNKVLRAGVFMTILHEHQLNTQHIFFLLLSLWIFLLLRLSTLLLFELFLHYARTPGGIRLSRALARPSRAPAWARSQSTVEQRRVRESVSTDLSIVYTLVIYSLHGVMWASKYLLDD